jgi:hypothetical protein
MSGAAHHDIMRATLLLASLFMLQPAYAQDAKAGKPQLVRQTSNEQGKPTVQADIGKPMAAEVLIVLASGEDGAIDPSLSHVRALKHPPFNEYKTLKLLSRSHVQLPREEPVEIALPNGRTLVLRLVSLLHDGRAKIQVSISRPHRKEYLPFLEVIASTGEPFFVAGQRFEGGTLVLGIRAGDALKLSNR